MTSLYNPIQLILELYYMANGLAFEILNIILRICYRFKDLIENGLCQISRKLVQN